MTEAIKILSAIQYELKAPKNQFNSFGKYKYRSCEDILEGIKPLLDKHGAAIIVSDSIEAIGDRIYVKATATIIIGSEEFSSTGFAREASDKKGMDSAQVTGSTSSYARKYALNGLLCIDDTKDADSGNNSQQEGKDHPKTATEISREMKACNTLAELGQVWGDNIPHRAKLKDTEKGLIDALKEELKIKLTPKAAGG